MTPEKRVTVLGAFPVGPDGTVFTVPLDVDAAAAMIQEAGEKADAAAAAEAEREAARSAPGRGWSASRRPLRPSSRESNASKLRSNVSAHCSSSQLEVSMNDEPPKRILVGVLPSGRDAVFSFEDIASPLLAEANRKVAVSRAERERAGRETIVVNRAWLLEVLRDLIRRLERDKTLAGRRGDRYRSAVRHYEAHRVREGFDAAVKRSAKGSPR